MYIHRHFDWLGHIAEALVIALVVAALALFSHRLRIAILIGLAFAMGHFHGREKRDYEIWAKIAPPHLEAYFIWNWNWDQLTDFLPVVVVMIALGVAADRWLRR